MLYEIEGTLDEKSTALRRVRVLIQSAFDKLSEPFPVVIEATQRILRGNAVELDTRDARDVAQVVTFAALNWREAGDLP